MMGGMSLSDARDCSWWEYSAMLTLWNDRHTNEEDEPVEPPTEEWVKHRAMILAERGLTGASIH